MNTLPPQTWLSIQGAAKALSCSVSHIRRMVKAGKLQCQDIGLQRQKMMRVMLPSADPALSTPTPKKRRRYVPKILTS